MSLLNRLLHYYDSAESTQLLTAKDQEQLAQDSTVRRAAVLMAVTNEDMSPQLVLTQRAKHLSSHPGQISFPGGMWEVEDKNLAQTALRESWEEIGLSPEAVQLTHRFDSLESRFGVHVTPFLGIIPKGTKLLPCEKETEQVFTVPLEFFVEQSPERIDSLFRGDTEFKVPAWLYQDKDIWGLTAMIIDIALAPLRKKN